MCDIRRLSSTAHCSSPSVYKITVNLRDDLEIIEVCEEHYEGALSVIGTFVRAWCPFELKVERLAPQPAPIRLGKIA